MRNIILVEDDRKLSDLIASFLKEHHFNVQQIFHGNQAIDAILTQAPELVILDVMLPGKDGFEICQSIRNQYQGKIVMLTAKDENINQIQGLDLGADDYIAKPIDPEVLLARIKARLKEMPFSKKIYTFGKLRIEMDAQQVYIKEQLCELMPKEFELLMILIKHLGKAVSRDEIMQKMRGFDHDGIDRSIDLRISRLRKKLHADGEYGYMIKTIRSKGYLFYFDAQNNV